MLPKVLAPSIPEGFRKRLKDFDNKLEVAFNCQTERWELYRISRGKVHWVMAIEEEDGSYRPLDERVFKKLYEIDVIARYGSVANYEKYMDEKQKKWQDGEQKKADHELRYDIKDTWPQWQKAAEEARSGRINDPPEEKERKIISYSK